MERVIKGLLFFALTWIVITVLVIIFHYFFFRPVGYEADLITFFLENFNQDLVIIFFVWGILTIFSILAYYKIKSGN